MDPRSTISGRIADRRGRGAHARRRPPLTSHRPGLYLGMAAAGAVLVNVLVGADPAEQAEAGASEPVSVAQQLGMTAQSGPAVDTQDLRPLEQLAASRSSREAARTAAQQVQAAADQTVLAQQQAAAEAAAQASVAAAAAPEQAAEPVVAATAVAATVVAQISNSSGNVQPQAQAAANAVVANVPGADGITIGGTRASATDPGGHPSGLALDYMVGTDAALGDAIAQYQIEHWDELGVEYVIWQQRMLSSPTGSWQPMEDRGSTTANHYDHVHVNYRR
jgi:hypothetical protein